MRLNLDKVPHPIHCYYPASGKKYFDRLRYGTAYHENITVIEHPIEKPGIVDEDTNFRIYADFLDHGVENLGWRITEHDKLRFDKAKLDALKLRGPIVKQLEQTGSVHHEGKDIFLDDVSSVVPGASIAVVIDTRPCDQAIQLAKNARLLLTEATYLNEEKHLALAHKHLTSTEAAEIAKEAEAQMLVLTHFSARYLDPLIFEEEARKIFPKTFAAHDLQRFSFMDHRP